MGFSSNAASLLTTQRPVVSCKSYEIVDELAAITATIPLERLHVRCGIRTISIDPRRTGARADQDAHDFDRAQADEQPSRG